MLKFFSKHVLYSIIWTNYIMEVPFMGMKNIFKKSSKVFDRDGFYVILFVCLCVVAVAAVYITNNKGNLPGKLGLEQPGIENTQQPPTNSVDLVLDDETEKPTAPVVNQPPKTTNENTETNSGKKPDTNKDKTPGDTKKTETSSTTNKFKIDMPVEGAVIKEYDTDNVLYSQTMQQWETHEGIDIACDIGTEVKAAADGKVVDVLNGDAVIHNLKSGYGITVVIEHGNGMRTMYSNLSDDIKVKKGDVVKKGNVIGSVGDTSIREAVSIEGSHLHFAVLKKVKDKYESVKPSTYAK